MNAANPKQRTIVEVDFRASSQLNWSMIGRSVMLVQPEARGTLIIEPSQFLM